MVKIGDALKKAVETEIPEVDSSQKKGKTTSTLMNDNRRRIFQFLCNQPCSKAGTIATTLKVSRVTASWHLKVLVEMGYLTVFRCGGKEHFCPKDMISPGNAMVLMATLNNHNTRLVYSAILGSPGIDTATLREIGTVSSLSGQLNRLDAVGLIQIVKDGRSNRFFPTRVLEQTIKTERTRLKSFRSLLIRRLEKDHLKPEVKELKGEGLVIQLTIHDTVEDIVIPYHPIEEILTSSI